MDEVVLAEYLWNRLFQLGVKSLHGVPGDFNLVALDYVEKAGMNWVGNCNELEAAYAADGYARASDKIGAMVTVIGVGELSAINACSGSYAEYVPVVYIVGTPPTQAQKSKLMLHHTLGDGDFDVFSKMFEAVTVAQTNLIDAQTAASEIDRVLRECWIQKRPVYIRLPTDMVNLKVPRSRLDIPIDLELPINDAEIEGHIVATILDLLYKAKRPIILSDFCAARHQVLEETHELVLKSKLPSFVTPMGKSSINESLPNFCGTYLGAMTIPSTKKYVEAADLILTLGSFNTDLNSGFFTNQHSPLKIVELHHNRVEISGAIYPKIHMKSILQKVCSVLDVTKLQTNDYPMIPKSPVTPPKSPERGDTSAKRTFDQVEGVLGGDEMILHAYLWPRMSSWFRVNDVIITENGTASFGSWECKLPEGARTINQTLWGSIGYTLPAAQGASMALKDLNIKARTILFIGDGSFQLTCQSLSTIMAHNLPLTLFLIANEGYTIERYIHGWSAKYNDIIDWDWKNFPSVMSHTPLLHPPSLKPLLDSTSKPEATSTSGSQSQHGNTHILDEQQGIPKKNFRVYECRTRSQLEEFLNKDSQGEGKGGLEFVILRMPREDAPHLCKAFAEAAANSNKRARLS